MKIEEIGNPQKWQLSSIAQEIKSKHFCDPFEPCEWCQVLSKLQGMLNIYNSKLDSFRSDSEEHWLSIMQVMELQELFIKLLPEVRRLEQELWTKTAKTI